MGKRRLFFWIIIFIISSISLNLNGQTCDAGTDIGVNDGYCFDNGTQNVDLDSLLTAARSKNQNSKKVFGRRWVFKDGPNGPRGKRVARIKNEKTADFPNTGAGPEEYYAFYYIETDETCADTAVVNICTRESINRSFKEVSVYYCEGQPISNKDELLNVMPLDRMRDKEGNLKKEGDSTEIPISDYTFPLDEGAYSYVDGSLNNTNVLIYKVPCSTKQIYFSFDNAQNTNDGFYDYYEVDVMVHGDSNFKLRNGKLFFTYNNEAFGEYINAYESVNISFPDGYILEQGSSNEFEAFDNTNGDSTNRFSFNFIQYVNNPDKNVSTTPAKLFHLKIKYLDNNKPPMIAFESDGIYDDQFNITSGTSINKITNDFFDSSGSALEPENDISQNSINLNGTTDYIAVQHNESLSLESNFTIEAWIKPNDINGEKTIFIKGNNGQCGNYGLFIKDGNLAFVSGGECSWASSRGPNSVLEIGVWQHVAAVGNSNSVSLYINGELKDNIARSAVLGPINNDQLWIGRSIFSTTNFFFNGLLDEVRIWDVAKSQTELQSSLNTELSGLESDLVLYYKLDEINEECDVSDCSINENHGSRINISNNTLPPYVNDYPSNLSNVECGVAFSNCNSFKSAFQIFVDSVMTNLQQENANNFLNDITQVTDVIQDLQFYYNNNSQIEDEFYNFLEDLCTTYPIFFQINQTYDDVESKYLGSFREQVHMFLRDYLRYYPEKENQFINALDLTNANAVKYLKIWNDYQILVVDNYSLSELQLDVIDNLLVTIPSNTTKLGVILFREFYTDDYENAIYITQSESAVNSFGPPIGTSSGDGFPADFNSFISDTFPIALSHEICHTIDFDYLRLNPRLNNWKNDLLAAAGTTYNEYLRTRVLDIGGNDFFQISPQEFFASLANIYFSNSALTLDLAIERFNQGFKQPINQFLLMADALSSESNSTQFYIIDEISNIDLSYHVIERNNKGFISGIYLNDQCKIEFIYDTNDFVTEIINPECIQILLDEDNDGVMNDMDQCPDTLSGETVNADGCAQSQLDDDSDGVMNDVDICASTPTGETVDATGCSESQIDDDGDGVMNDKDLYPNTPEGANVDANGGLLIDPSLFNISWISSTCPNIDNAQISIKINQSYPLDVTVNGPSGYSKVTNNQVLTSPLVLTELASGQYQVSFSFTNDLGADNNGYILNISEAPKVTGKAIKTDKQSKTAIFNVSGDKSYLIFTNGEYLKEVTFLDESVHEIVVDKLFLGENYVKIVPKNACRGIVEHWITIHGQIQFYPNPTQELVTLKGLTSEIVNIQVFNTSGSQLFNKKYETDQGMVTFSLENKPSGVYIVKVIGNENDTVEFKVIKK